MQKKYPFKFLNAYELDDIDFFFGRDEEIGELYQMVFQSNLVLVYGKSGTGKTSLIQCGLANRFKSYDWLALYIRKGENLLSSLDKKLCEESDGAFEYQERTEASGKAQQPIENLAEKIDAVYKASFKPIYLIFDQFEELYTLRNQPGEQQNFIKVVQQLLELNQPVKIIISIREEYLGYLYDFERAVPELLRKKLRVDAMHRDKVKHLLIKIGDSEDSNVHLDQNEKEDIAGKIFDIVRGEEKALSIQLPYLQVFMEKVYVEKTGDESKATEATFTMADLNKIGTLGDVLRDFLDKQVEKIALKLKQKKEETIWTILSPFVSLDGTKRPITVKELEADLPNIAPKLIEEALDYLEDNRIVRFLEKEERYEISHDSLAKQIDARRSDEQKQIMQVKRLIHSQTDLPVETRQFFNKNTLALLDAAKELYQPTAAEQEWIDRSRTKLVADEVEKEAKKEAELKATKSSLRRVRMFSALAFVTAVIAMFFFFSAEEATEKAEKAKVEAEKATKIAEIATEEVKGLRKEIIDSSISFRRTLESLTKKLRKFKDELDGEQGEKLEGLIVDFETLEKESKNSDLYKLITSDSCYVLNIIAYEKEKRAQERVRQLKNEGYEAGYLWPPDYSSLSNTELWVVFVGPFNSIEECETAVEDYKKINPEVYGVKVAHDNERVEIMGRNNIKRIPDYNPE